MTDQQMTGIQIDLPTGSGISVFLACPGAKTLPKVIREDDRSDNMQRGTDIHKFLEDTFNFGSPQLAHAGMGVGDTADFCSRLDTTSIIPKGTTDAELSWSYNPGNRAVRVLGRSLNRNYPIGPGEIAGTADCVFLRDGIPGIADYKCTNFDVWAPPPQESGQLKFLGLCLMRERGLDRCWLETIRIDSSGRPHITPWLFDAIECHAFEEQLLGAYRAPPVFVEGQHCRSCRKVSMCPAKYPLLRQLARPIAGQGLDVEITTENAPRLVRAIEDAEALVGALRKELKKYAEDFPIEMPSGDIYGPIYRSYRTISDPKAAHAFIETQYGAERADKILKTTQKITIDAVETVLGKEDGEKCLHKMREIGIVTTRDVKSVGIHSPRRGKN